MKNSIKNIYEHKKNFIVIGLTGKTGSGCSTVAKILKNGYLNYDAKDCLDKPIQNRKDKIIKKYASVNFKNKDFKIIKPSTIIMMLFIFEKKIIFNQIKELKISIEKYKEEENDKLKEIILDKSNKIIKLFTIYKSFKIEKDFDLLEKDINSIIDDLSIQNIETLIDSIVSIKTIYQKNLLNQDSISLKKEVSKLFGFSNKILNDLEINNYSKIKKVTKKKITDKFNKKRKKIDEILAYISKNYSRDFIKLYKDFNDLIYSKRNDGSLRVSSLQMIGDLVRSEIDIFMIPQYTNFLVKAYKNKQKESSKNKHCYIIIDSLKNPFEIFYLKERYSAYYTLSVHATDETIYNRFPINKQDDKDETIIYQDDIKNIHQKELYKDIKGKQKESLDSIEDFNSQNIIECIQRSDIYIDNNKDKNDTLYKQVFKYLSLMIHPGLITPTKDEMIMQLALNAKFNSGCISRQVGAVVLNKHDSVKAVGWNEVPEGQMPCLLRSHNELLNNSVSIDYSSYERSFVRTEPVFKHLFIDIKNFKEKLNKLESTNDNIFKESNKLGLNDSFCFKEVQNRIENNKNQVYTRSLHAEENAFLQASKYGNTEIIGGQLFTTASPCFLCAKKAYQLGIKRIVYIEAYPDISNEQVFNIGRNDIEMVHFRGASGLAYQKLYEPIFSYKDELKALNK